MSSMLAEPMVEEPDEGSLFDLKVCALVMADPAGEISSTSDNCSSTCGACTTGAA